MVFSSSSSARERRASTPLPEEPSEYSFGQISAEEGKILMPAVGELANAIHSSELQSIHNAEETKLERNSFGITTVGGAN